MRSLKQSKFKTILVRNRLRPIILKLALDINCEVKKLILSNARFEYKNASLPQSINLIKDKFHF